MKASGRVLTVQQGQGQVGRELCADVPAGGWEEQEVATFPVAVDSRSIYPCPQGQN